MIKSTVIIVIFERNLFEGCTVQIEITIVEFQS